MQGKDPETGRYLPGNRFWAMRSSFGNKPKFDAPEDLWAAAVEYFDWVESNPLHEAKAFAYEGKVTVEALPKMRAMSTSGLCLFLDISLEAWRGWRTPGHKLHRPDLAEVIAQVDAVIWTQKFEGGAAELLNPNLVARDLGLADKKQLGNDPENPLPAQQVTIFALPDNGRG